MREQPSRLLQVPLAETAQKGEFWNYLPRAARGLACSALWLCLRDAGTMPVALDAGPLWPHPSPGPRSRCSSFLLRPCCSVPCLLHLYPGPAAPRYLPGIRAPRGLRALEWEPEPLGADRSSDLGCYRSFRQKRATFEAEINAAEGSDMIRSTSAGGKHFAVHSWDVSRTPGTIVGRAVSEGPRHRVWGGRRLRDGRTAQGQEAFARGSSRWSGSLESAVPHHQGLPGAASPTPGAAVRPSAVPGVHGPPLPSSCPAALTCHRHGSLRASTLGLACHAGRSGIHHLHHTGRSQK